MLDITLVAIGEVKDQSLRALSLNYLKRLKPYLKLEVVELPARSFSASSRQAAKEKEAQAINDYLTKRQASNRPAKVYLLAERGKTQDSLAFSKWLKKEEPLIVVMGGALGFSDELYKRYPQISLSPLTFPHELARLIFLEQIYRSATILNGKDYHY